MADEIKVNELLLVDATVYELEEFRDHRGSPGVRNRWWASVQGGPDTPRSEVLAVARKMRAADDLLAACKLLMGYVPAPKGVNRDVIEAAESAIAKAEPENLAAAMQTDAILARRAELKKRDPDAILLFRVADHDGDWYRAYGDDIEKIMDTTYPDMWKHVRRHNEWVGFPPDSIERLLACVVAAGRRAAVCERVESPK